MNKLAALRFPPAPLAPCIPLNEKERGRAKRGRACGCEIASVCIILNKESERMRTGTLSFYPRSNRVRDRLCVCGGGVYCQDEIISNMLISTSNGTYYTQPDMGVQAGTHEERGGTCSTICKYPQKVERSTERKAGETKATSGQWKPASKPCAGRIIMRLGPIYQRHNFICK